MNRFMSYMGQWKEQGDDLPRGRGRAKRPVFGSRRRGKLGRRRKKTELKEKGDRGKKNHHYFKYL